MIRVIMYLDQGGISNFSDWEVLGRIDIQNDVWNSLETEGRKGTYNAVIRKKRPSPWKRVKIRNYSRRAYHPWELIRLILNEAARQNKGHI